MANLINCGDEESGVGEWIQPRSMDISCLEVHPRTCKLLGSPLFTSHEFRPFIRGKNNPI